MEESSKTILSIPNYPLIRIMSTSILNHNEIFLAVGAIDVTLLLVDPQSMTIKSSRTINSHGIPAGFTTCNSSFVFGGDDGILQFCSLESSAATKFHPVFTKKTNYARGVSVSPWGIYMALLIESPCNPVQRNLVQFEVHIFETAVFGDILHIIVHNSWQHIVFLHDVLDYVRRHIKNDTEVQVLPHAPITDSLFLLNILKLHNHHVKQNSEFQSRIESISEVIAETSRVKVEKLVEEKCGICGSEVEFVGLMAGRCSGGHAVGRCPLTWRICAPFGARECDFCGVKYSIKSEDIFGDCEMCLFCNKLLM